jgi:acyl-CoA hydrolase
VFRKKGKPPKESATEMVQVVLPNDANPLGHVLGGKVMHWIDLVGAIVAYRHSRCPVVTASMERLDFHSPIRIGEIVKLKGVLHYAGRTSMQVGVEVFSENPISGRHTHTSSAHLTYVALNRRGKPTGVPKLLPETEEDWTHYRVAEDRRRRRLNELRRKP